MYVVFADDNILFSQIIDCLEIAIPLWLYDCYVNITETVGTAYLPYNALHCSNYRHLACFFGTSGILT